MAMRRSTIEAAVRGRLRGAGRLHYVNKLSRRTPGRSSAFIALLALGLAASTEAANDPKDLTSQNAEDASVVQNTGQAHLRIEIPVPRGTGGSEPELALTYSSHPSDGAFGVGWGLELGEIRRSARFGTPRYDSADRFEFDGVLLVADPSNPGQYRTLEESFARITRSVDGSEDQWLVEFPDGRKARFGTDQRTRIRKDGSLNPEDDWGAIGRWLLSELEDAHGNITRITYDRSRDVGTAYPRSISYTYRDGSETPVGGDGMKRRIEFRLEARRDELGREEVIYGFPLGIETRIGMRVREIRSFVGGDVYRRLILTYAGSAGYTTGRSRLETAQMFGAYCQVELDPTTKCRGLPPKTFTYTDSDAIGNATGAQWDTNAVWRGEESLHFTQGEEKDQGRDRGVRVGDINGDGYPDYVQAWARANSSGTWDATHQVYLNDGSGWGIAATAWKAKLEALGVPANYVDEQRYGGIETCSARKYFAADLNFKVFFRWENPFNNEQLAVYDTIAPPIEARLVDLNADGFSDIILSFEVGAGSSTATSRCGPGSWSAPVEVKRVFINNGIEDPLAGGGWTDQTASWASSLPIFYSIYLRSDGGYASETPGFAWTPGKWRTNLADPPGNPGNGLTFAYFFDHGVRMPDLNGDGRPDIIAKRDPITFGSGGPVVTFEEGAWLSNSDGTGWDRQDGYLSPVSIVAEFNFKLGYPKYVHDADAGVRFADLNGDGLADLAKTRVEPDSGHGPLSSTLLDEGVWLNTGSGWCGAGEGNPDCDVAQKYLPPTGFTSISAVYQPPAPTGGGGNAPLVRSSELAFVDLNGDDLVDLLKTDSPNLTGLGAWIHDPSDPEIWVQDDRFTPHDVMATTGRWLEAGNLYIFDNGVRIFDFNGDATVDFLKDEAMVPRAIHLSITAHADLLKTIENGQGGRQEFEYTSAIAQREPNFENLAQADADDPETGETDSIGLPRWTARAIVSRLTTTDTLPGGVAHAVNLIYAMPRWDPINRSLLGFRSVRASNDDGSAELTHFWQAPGRTGKVHRSSIYAGELLKRMRTTEWEVVSGSDAEGSIMGVKIGRLVREESANYYGDAENPIAGSNQSATYTYADSSSNAYGYNFVHRIEISRPTGDLIIDRVPEPENTLNWIVGKIDKEIVIDANGDLLRQTEFDYERGLPTHIRRLVKHRYVAGEETHANTRNDYDVYGNLVRSTDPEGRVTSLCYDGDSSFFADGSACSDQMGTNTHSVVVALRDPLGDITRFSGSPIDLADGRLTATHREYSGESNRSVVDSFGRETQYWAKPSGHPTETILATRVYFDDPADPENSAGRAFVEERYYYEPRSAIDDGATIRMASYRDGLGRDGVLASPAPAGQVYPFGRAITERDHAGRPLRGTLDLACTDANCANLAIATYPGVDEITQTYDALGRVLTRTTPDGVTAFDYRQQVLTLPAGSKAHTSVSLDAILTKDPNGILTEHLLDGNRLVMTNECNNVVPATMIDLASVSCSNPESTFYTYEASGELESIYDADSAQDYGSSAHRLTYRYDTLGRVWLLEDPDGGTKFTIYDLAGNAIQTVNLSNGSDPIRYEYDELNRLKLIDPPDQISDWDLTVLYDPITRKRKRVISTGSYSESWEYDDFGNLAMNVRSVFDRTLRTDFDYDLLGRPKRLQSPLAGDHGISYVYDGGYLVKICSKLDIGDCESDPSLYYVNGVNYDALGRVSAISEHPGELQFEYYSSADPEPDKAVRRLKRIKLNPSGSKLNLAYRYNRGGQVIRVEDAHTGDALDATADYGYDQRGRLGYWKGADNVEKYFAYDELGNLVGKNLARAAANAADWNQFYDDVNRPHAITRNHRGKSYSYDGAGNVTQRGDEHFTYNALGQIYCVGTSASPCAGGTFRYDIDGNLLAKTAGGSSEIFLGDYFRFDKRANIAWTYTSAFGRRIVMQKKTEVSLRSARSPASWRLAIDRDLFRQLVLAAALLGVLALLAGLGARESLGERPATVSFALVLAVLVAVAPQAWAGKKGRGGGGKPGAGGTTRTRYLFHDHLGSVVLAVDPDGDVKERRVFGPYGSVIAAQIDRKASAETAYTGKPYHAESDLYDFGARWYDAEAGRFVAIDPILQSLPDPQTHNPYTYVRNDPIGYVDPDGREAEGHRDNNNIGSFVAFVAAGIFGFGGETENSDRPSVPQGPPAGGDAVAAANPAPFGEEPAQAFGDSTAKRYGRELGAGRERHDTVFDLKFGLGVTLSADAEAGVLVSGAGASGDIGGVLFTDGNAHAIANYGAFAYFFNNHVSSDRSRQSGAAGGYSGGGVNIFFTTANDIESMSAETSQMNFNFGLGVRVLSLHWGVTEHGDFNFVYGGPLPGAPITGYGWGLSYSHSPVATIHRP